MVKVSQDGLQKQVVNDNAAVWVGFADCKPNMNVRGTNVRMTGTSSGGLIPGQSGQWTSVQTTSFTITIGAGSDVRTAASWSEGGDNEIPTPFAGVMYDCTKWEHGTWLIYSVTANFRLTRANNTSITVSNSHSIQVFVWNVAALYGRYDIEVEPIGNSGTAGDDNWLTFPSIYSYLQSSYQRNFVSTFNWNKDMMYQSTVPSTLFYVSSHGNPSFFWTDTNDNHMAPLDRVVQSVYAFTQQTEQPPISSLKLTDYPILDPEPLHITRGPRR